MILLKNNNKVLKNKEGKVLISHNIPFTPVCEQFIHYEPKKHSFTRVGGYAGSSSAGFLHNNFIIPINLSGDFEISWFDFGTNYHSALIVSRNDTNECRGFFKTANYGERIKASTSADKRGDFKISGVVQSDKEIFDKADEYWRYDNNPFNKVYSIRRVKGIVTLYFNNKVFYTYKDKYLTDNLTIYGKIETNNTGFKNLSIKQL